MDLTQWATRWQLPPQAIAELQQLTAAYAYPLHNGAGVVQLKCELDVMMKGFDE